MKFPAILAALIVAGCAGSFQSPETTVYTIRSGYVVALQAAVTYETQPRCPAEPVCSDPEIVDLLRKSDLTAKAALDAAETTVRNHPEIDAGFAIDAARNAVSAFQAILPLYVE